MTRTLLTAIFLTLFSQTAWADEILDKVRLSATILATLDKSGADCRAETYGIVAEKA